MLKRADFCVKGGFLRKERILLNRANFTLCAAVNWSFVTLRASAPPPSLRCPVSFSFTDDIVSLDNKKVAVKHQAWVLICVSLWKKRGGKLRELTKCEINGFCAPFLSGHEKGDEKPENFNAIRISEPF